MGACNRCSSHRSGTPTDPCSLNTIPLVQCLGMNRGNEPLTLPSPLGCIGLGSARMPKGRGNLRMTPWSNLALFDIRPCA